MPRKKKNQVARKPGLAGLVEELKCDQCGKHLSCAPVLLSSGGANVCGRCWAPDHPQHTFTRNHVYEKVVMAAQLLFPCKNRAAGCLERLPMSQAQLHEECCPFNDGQRVSCPAAPAPDTCPWTGSLRDLEAHYRAAHETLIAKHPYTDKQDFHRESASSLLMMLYGFAFLIQVKCAAGKLWQTVRLLGHPCLAKLFHFCVRFNRGHACVQETRQVSDSNNFAIGNENSTSNVVKNLLTLLGDYDDIDFELRVTMRDVECCTCKKKLDRAPIYPALEEGSYNCADCHQGTSSFARFTVQCSRCSRKLKWTPVVPGCSAGPLCPPCHAWKQCSVHWKTCMYRDSGCHYGYDSSYHNWDYLARHYLRRCSYMDWQCGECGARNTGCDTREIVHIIEEHSTQLTPVFTGDSATVTTTVTMGSDTRSIFTMSINTVVFLLEMDIIPSDSIYMSLTTDTECRGTDIFKCKYKIALSNSQNEINGEMSACYPLDWRSDCDVDQFPPKSEIRITLIINKRS